MKKTVMILLGLGTALLFFIPRKQEQISVGKRVEISMPDIRDLGVHGSVNQIVNQYGTPKQT